MEGTNASFERTSVAQTMEDKRQDSSVEVSSSSLDDGELESTKVEMGEVRKENERLRMHLDRMIKEYQELQKHVQKATMSTKNDNNIIPSSMKNNQVVINDATSDPHRELEEENKLVSLSLGRPISTEMKHQGIISKGSQGSTENDWLGLGLRDYKLRLYEESKSEKAPAEAFPRPGLENISLSAEDTTKEESAVGGSSWPQKISKRRAEFENSEPSHPSSDKRARVCLRIRCETPTMNDGCQWRKYGQKIAKGNPCPRAYYRCTVAPACPVRKQVQRCAEDMSILIITYEGTHNHPLPISATNMASTTSAAASMLLSGPSNSNTSRPSSNIDGLSFYPPNTLSNKQNNIIQPQYQLPTSSSSSIPSHNPHFSVFSRPNYPAHFSSPPTSLNFSSSFSPWESNSSNNNMFCYNSFQANTTSNTSNQFATLPLDHQNSNFYQSSLQRNNNSADTTMTAAITSDPSFQTALAAALSNIIGSHDGPLRGMISSGVQLGNSMSYQRRDSSLMLGQATVPNAVPKSTSTSPGASNRENSI